MLLDGPLFNEQRQIQLARAHGDILEIGMGTGLNLPHYPKPIHRITSVDPNPGMASRLHRRVTKTGIAVDHHPLSTEELPFADGSFDCVVSTLTLCSVANKTKAMAEIYRVLKEDGEFLFLEHGLAANPRIAWFQKKLNPIQSICGDGCCLTMEFPKLLQTQPFTIGKMSSYYLPWIPWTHGYVYRGYARKSSGQ